MGGKFFWIILATYICISQNFFVFHKIEWMYLYRCDFSNLKIRNTPTNKFLLFMLDKYKYISHEKKERNYFYYSKKICKFLAILSIPWFVVVYLMHWYLIESFVKWHWLFSSIICLLPTILLSFMMTIYEIKSKLYGGKKRNDEKKH